MGLYKVLKKCTKTVWVLHQKIQHEYQYLLYDTACNNYQKYNLANKVVQQKYSLNMSKFPESLSPKLIKAVYFTSIVYDFGAKIQKYQYLELNWIIIEISSSMKNIPKSKNKF